jgi:hypothetical protein
MKVLRSKPSYQMSFGLIDTYASLNINLISVSRLKPSCQISYKLVNTNASCMKSFLN